MPIDLKLPVDPGSRDWQRALEVLQGNILRSHGRDYTALLIIQLEPSPGLRAQVRKLGESWVTSAKQQVEQAKQYRLNAKKKAGPDKQLFGNLFLSVWGYAALGYSEAELFAAFRHPQDLLLSKSNWFMHGMEHKGEVLADPPRLDWEPAYRNHLDALLLLACDDREELERKVSAASSEISAFGKVLYVEKAKTHRRGDFAVEHFGFADGISQPRFFKDDASDKEPPKSVLEPDRLAGEPDAFGSYLVYRKLEQNVKGFLEDEARLADALRLSGQDRERAGAMIVGRFRDGTPLTKSGKSGGTPPGDNDFNYNEQGGDPGDRCPMHAHIRKVRPRGRIKYPRARIVRRGVPYGPYDPTDPKMKPPEKGSGLLFLSFQRNIESQFGRVQSNWMNTVDAPEEGAGQDTVSGQGWTVTRQLWPWEWGKEPCLRFKFGNYMRLLGGEFFFAPSLDFFRKLAKGKS
jgi:Dyp-type peroxidase family